MLANFDTTTLILFFVLVAIIGLVIVIIFARKNNFANILIILNGIQRFYFNIGFAFQPYLFFSIPLLGGLIIKRDLNTRLFHLVKVLRPIAIPSLGLILSLFACGLFTGSEIKSIRQYILLSWSWIIICFYLMYIQSSNEIIKTTKFIVNYSGILSIIGIIFFVLHLLGIQFVSSGREGIGFVYQNPDVEYGRLRCFDTDPNAYSLYILPMFFQALGWLQFCKSVGKRTALPLLIVVLLFANLVLTFSRGAFISIVLGFACVFLVMLLNIRHITKNQLWLIKVLGIVIILIFLSSNLFIDILGYVKTGYKFRSDFETSRYSKWEISLEIFLRNIFFGIGQGRLKEYTGYQAHNTWMELLAENGIFSGIFMFWILYVLVSKSIILVNKLFKLNDTKVYILLGGLSGLVSMIIMMSSVSLITVIYFWFQIGYVLLMIYFFKEENTIHTLDKPRELVQPNCNE